MISTLNIIIATGLLAILYSYIVSKQILSASPGNAKMQEVANAIQVGAKAYLNRQYKTIALVGIIILVIITYALGIWVGLGYFVGAFLSGAAGYVGMLVSVQANVRTAEASRKGLASGLNIGFKSGAVTGMLVAGLALLAIAIYYLILLKLNIDNREIINALIGLGFGASLISIFARLGGGIFTKGADVGADFVMVKPGMPYLDIIKLIKDNFKIPVFAYQVSGEYSLIKNGINNKILNEDAIIESLMSFKRAGASAVVTYFAEKIAQKLR